MSMIFYNKLLMKSILLLSICLFELDISPAYAWGNLLKLASRENSNFRRYPMERFADRFFV